MAEMAQELLMSCSDLAHDARWKLVTRIVATPSFAKSDRLCTLLLFVTQQSLRGNRDSLCEQMIGEQVYGRPVGYDSRDDNIVRSHASRLRQRLDTYFREEASGESLRVTLPRGSYVPVFERATQESQGIAASPLLESSELAKQRFPVPEPLQPHAAWLPQQVRSRSLWLGLLSAACLLLVLAFVAWHPFRAVAQQERGRNTPSHSTVEQRLWHAMFDNNHDTIVVPADSSLVLLKHFTKRSVSLADYASGHYLTQIRCPETCDTALLTQLVKHRYTSLADLKFASDLMVLQKVSARTEVRYARDIQLDDLKQKNAILIGSSEADPWVELFQSRLNFVLEDNRSGEPVRILNRHPLQGEKPEYKSTSGSEANPGYATISFLPNLGGTGKVLIVQGFTLAGTQAAAEFLRSGEFASTMPAIQHESAELPSFEVLLETHEVNGLASSPRVVAKRIH